MKKNKYQEALDKIINSNDNEHLLRCECCDILQKLIDKETPMKRKKIYDELLFSSYSICPKCNSKVSPICCYCAECGQKLDWSEEHD